MSHTLRDTHLSAERIQALLDGGLPQGERRRAEEHLASCGACASEAERWSTVFRELDELPRLVPLEGFRARVMGSVRIPEGRSVLARLKDRVAGLLPSGRDAHVPTQGLQELAEGALPRRIRDRFQSHVDGCGACARELAGWRRMVDALDGLGRLEPPGSFAADTLARWRLERRLDALDHLEPSEGFAARVMAGVRVPERARAVAAAPAPASPWDRLAAAARGLVPSTRRAWAALSGVAVTPAVTMGLVVWTLVSHPTLTAGSLVSFAWWKLTDLAAVGWSSALALAGESVGSFGLSALAGTLLTEPTLVAGVGLAFAAGSLVSLWVLYKNLVATHTVDGRYAHANF